jgi:hypothetical protein
MGAAANRETADAFAANVLPVVRELQAAGVTTVRAIAEALNARGIRTALRGVANGITPPSGSCLRMHNEARATAQPRPLRLRAGQVGATELGGDMGLVHGADTHRAGQ